MDWVRGIQRAIDYMEAHLTEETDYETLARESFSSPFHFQRVFSILCGMTVGEYIRLRRLSLAGTELARGKAKVIDVALKYGYESPESFTRAFQRFHGITPSQARTDGAVLRSFSPLSLKISLEGGKSMNYRIEEKLELRLTGFKRRFTGEVKDMGFQDHYFACETRMQQYLLEGMSRNHTDTWCVMCNFGPDGYDYYFAQPLPDWILKDFDEDLGEYAKMFEHITVPAGKYMICETERTDYPTDLVEGLRREMVGSCLPASGCRLRSAPEVDIIHWPFEEGNEELNHSKFVEVWLPIE